MNAIQKLSRDLAAGERRPTVKTELFGSRPARPERPAPSLRRDGPDRPRQPAR